MSFLIRILVRHCIQLCNLLCRGMMTSFLCHHIPYFDFDIPFDLLVGSVFFKIFTKSFPTDGPGDRSLYLVGVDDRGSWVALAHTHPPACWQSLFTWDFVEAVWMGLTFSLTPSSFQVLLLCVEQGVSKSPGRLCKITQSLLP